MTKLDEFRALVKASTEKPWVTSESDMASKGLVYTPNPTEPSQLLNVAICWRQPNEVADAALIAAMRGHIELFLDLWEAAEQVKRNFMAIFELTYEPAKSKPVNDDVKKSIDYLRKHLKVSTAPVSGPFAGMDMMQREYEDRLARVKMENTFLHERLAALERVFSAAQSVLSEEGVKEYLSAYVMGVELIDRVSACDVAKEGE